MKLSTALQWLGVFLLGAATTAAFIFGVSLPSIQGYVLAFGALVLGVLWSLLEDIGEIRDDIKAVREASQK